ncbi:MAG: hypothetical protein EPO36_02695 [Chloroflexota bacterium]|nr:MAG: hypothetical protein EPO36_02695 [Chloroflexota bacterium]
MIGDRGPGGRPANGPAALGRLARALVAVLVAAGLTLTPPAAGPAAAATGRLLTTSSATYTVDIDAATVHVSDIVTLTNDKPSDATFDYFWREIPWYVQPDATRIRARDSSGALPVTTAPKDGYIEATVRLRSNLLFGQSVNVTISWDLPAGGPRSPSSIRVGPAFVAFELWASGDAGTSSVQAVLPRGFVVQAYGSTVETTDEADGVRVSAAGIADPLQFWVAVTATRDPAMASTTINPAQGVSLVVRGWPDDPEWRTTVSTTLDRGLPELLDLIGLPWPVDGDLEVTEIYSPLLEGYAGLYYTEEDRIEISEDLDTLVIVHELSHAWFNDGLFSGRWISEGQADTYAAVTLEALGEDRALPDEPVPGEDGEIDLMAWGPPQRITQETEARELWAYNASWFITNELFDEIGPDRMRAVFQAADENLSAYPGADGTEPAAGADDWRRYLDLLEEIGGSTVAEDLFREYVVTPTAARELDARATAREAYAELIEAGDEWLPPAFVRGELAAWRFASARSRISEAYEILALRDQIEAAAEDVDLEPGDGLEAAYEAATDNFVAAQDVARTELAVLETLAATDAAVDAPADLLSTIGLIGESPEADYAAAGAAFEAGDLDAAETAAQAALAVLTNASRVGRERLLAAVGVVFGLTAGLGIVLAIRARRRSARARAATATAIVASVAPAVPMVPVAPVAWPEAGAPVAPAPAVPPVAWPEGPERAAPIEPYGTLAADSPAPPLEADRAGVPDGGTADGDESSAST